MPVEFTIKWRNLVLDWNVMNQTTILLLAAALLMLGRFPVLAAVEPPPSPAPAAEWVTRSWLSEDGLPQDTVNTIVQTRDGFLWVGTNAGLARFDGVRFRTFGLQDGLRSVVILMLAEDREGTLWVATSGGGVSRWENERFTSFGVEEGFPTGADVIALAVDQDGSVWFGTVEGLVRWRDGTFAMIGEAEGLPRKQVRALLHDSRGTLWVSVITDGLFRSAGGQFTREAGLGPEGGNVYSLMEDREGAIWAGTNALWKWSGGEWKRFDSASGLPKSVIQTLAQSRDGTLWVGARSSGLYRSTGERFALAASDGSLATQSVAATMIDREGSVWAGVVSGGLHRLSPRVLQYWGANAGLPPTAVTSVVEDASGALLVGTANRGIQRFEKGRFSPLADPTAAGHTILYCTTTTSDGSIWAAGEVCLFRFQPGQPTKAYLDPPVRGEAIRAMCADGDTLWLGTYYSTLLKCEAGGVQVAAPRGSFSGGISSIACEAADTLWVGTTAGLHRWEHGKVRTWTTRDGLLTANIRALHRDPDGTLWIGTLGGGLARMRDGRFANITTRQGLIDDVISQIVPDDFGALWLGCNRGIMRVERRELDAVADGKISELHPVVFGRNEGMLKEQCFGGTSPTAFKTKDGRLLFPAMSGLAEIDPRRLQDLATHTPQARIDEIILDQRPHAFDAALVVPPGKHHLEFAYTAPALRGGEWVRFRHRLEGFDRDWVGSGRNRLATYDSLPPGKYVFRVAAADGQGNWNESGASLAFSVQPFFWQTLWFRAGGFFSLVCTSGAVVWWYTRRRHLRQLAEREQQAELEHLSRVSSLGQLSGSLAHELNQPLAIILSNAEAAEQILAGKSPDIEELKAIIQDIIGENQRAGEVIQSLRSLLKRGETRLLPLPLNEVAASVLRLMRRDLEARGVSLVTDFAEALPDVPGDRVQLQQVIMNLILNACDAMEGNPPEERLLRITTSLHRHGVRLSVHDQGCGLPKDEPGTVFKSFFTTKENGLGLGLSICRSIMAAHHGRIWAEPRESSGTVFHIELQAAEPPDA